jgi:uncharacterized coiled-coil DUF342 family protein
MDKKTKKKLDTIRHRLQLLRQQRAGAKKQPDEPDELRRLEREIAKLEGEAETLKDS